jgi:hypothetical protein
MGEKEVEALPEKLFGVTHTICPSCRDDVIRGLEDTPEQPTQPKQTAKERRS